MKLFRSITAFALIPVFFLAMTGCTSSATISDLVGTLGSTAESIATIQGNTALAAKLQTDVAAAQTAILSWKSGSPATEVIELLNIVSDDLALFPVTSTEAAYIQLGIATIDGILALLPQSATPAVAHSARAHYILVDTKTGKTLAAPKSAKQFNKIKSEITAGTVKISKA